MSTRPDSTEFLENSFQRFSYLFKPFSEDDQIEFLEKIWKRSGDYRKFIETLNKKIEVKQIEVPLVTRLIGEYFLEKIDDEHSIGSLESLNLSPLDLLQNFFEKKFEIHSENQSKNANSLTDTKQLLEIHTKLAFKVLFPKEFKKFFKNFDLDQETINELLNCDFVTYGNGKLKFRLKITAEYLIIKFIQQNFEEIHVFKFIFEVILIHPSCQLIRSLLNEFFSELIYDKNREIIRKLIIKTPEILHVAARESNLETFNAIFDVLLENFQGNFISNSIFSMKFKRILKTKDQLGVTSLYNLFAHCENPTDVLEKLKISFGSSFVKRILQIKNGENDFNLTGAAVQHRENYSALLTWIYRSFSEEPEFIKSVVLSKNKLQRDVLHNAVEIFNEESFFILLNQLKYLEGFTKVNFLKDLILHRNYDDETFLHNLMSLKSDEDSLMKTLVWIGNNSNCLSRLIFSKNHWTKSSLISDIASHFNKKPFDVLKDLQKSVNSNEFLFNSNFIGDTFLTEIIATTEELTHLTIEILQWLKKIDFNLLKLVVYSENNLGQNFIHRFCEIFDPKFVPRLIKSTVIWMGVNISGFNAGEFLRQPDSKRCTSLKHIVKICVREKVGPAVEFIEWIQRVMFRWSLKKSRKRAIYINKLTDCHFKPNILHQKCLTAFDKKSFFQLLSELKCLDQYFNDGLLRKQILYRNNNGETFISPLINILLKIKTIDETCGVLMEVLVWIDENTEFFDNLLLEKGHGDESVITYMSKFFKTNFFVGMK